MTRYDATAGQRVRGPRNPDLEEEAVDDPAALFQRIRSLEKEKTELQGKVVEQFATINTLQVRVHELEDRISILVARA